jgi:hypothetical protein
MAVDGDGGEEERVTIRAVQRERPIEACLDAMGVYRVEKVRSAGDRVDSFGRELQLINGASDMASA